MKKFKQKLSLMLMFFFMFTFAPRFGFKVKAETMPQADLLAIVAGNFIDDAGLGGEWAADNTQAMMKEYRDGVYELVFTSPVAVANGEYKVTLNKGWNQSYPAQNKSINIPENKMIIIRYNSKTNEVYDSVNEPSRFKTSAGLVGTLAQSGGQDWKPEDTTFDLDYVGGGFFKKSFQLKAGSYQYKVAYDHKWSNGEVGDNVQLTLDSDKEVTFLANPELGFCTDSIKVSEIAGTASLIGTIRPGTDKDWNVAETGFNFSNLNGDGKYIYSGFFSEAGNYEYKVVENYSWASGGIPSQSNRTITIPEGGKYVVFIVDRTTKEIVDSVNNYDRVAEILGLKQADVQVKSPVINNNGTVTFNYRNNDAREVFLAGGMTNWQNGKLAMTKDARGVWSINLALGGGDYEYKFIVDGNWITDPANNATINGNSAFTMPEFAQSPAANSDGTVTFNYNDVDGSAKSIQLAGSVLDRDWQTRRDFVKNGSVWSVTVTAKPGQYTYKFIVNGSWMRDPMNSRATGTGEMDNSIIYVPGYAKIKMPTQVKEGTTVQLVPQGLKFDGSFEDLDPSAVTWSADNDAVQVGANGILKAVKNVPEGQSNIAVKVTGTDSKGNSISEYIDVVREVTEVEGGRLVVLTGGLQTLIPGTSAWDPGARGTRMIYKGNGLYTYTIKDMPAGNYEYKIAMGSWDENYGKNGVRGGDNIMVSVPETKDVTFYYSDMSHYATDSTKYNPLSSKPVLKGLDSDYTMEDLKLSGVYNVEIQMAAGSYSNLKVVLEGRDYPVSGFSLTEARRVNFSFDTNSGWVFSDASSNNIQGDRISFNSRELEYKSPYGAVPEGTVITFNLKAAKDDLTQARLVVVTPDGSKMFDMTKSNLDENYDKWTARYTAGAKGMYKYYFLFTNGSQVKAYGDDDGYFGTGKVSNLDEILSYDLNIYDKNFKTPDWLKNAVIYQIFPDRFFNGDTSNDNNQILARGYVPYEFYNNWYAIPEDPQIENNDGYTGTKGDGNWSNEMYGGDLRGVEAKLDYLKALGVTVLYFNPISASISNHRYDAANYKELDPLLGHMEDFVKLTKEADKRGMHVILDGVFNHVSDDSVYFDRYGKFIGAGKPIGAYQYWSRVYDQMNEKGLNRTEAENRVQVDLKAAGITDLHYKDWFVVQNQKIDLGKATEHYNYEGWWGFDSMPVIQSLNGSEYNVDSWAKEIIDGQDSNTRYWLRQGSDGWRLDVANEVSDETWRNFRKAVREEGDNAIIGEIWTDASKYLLGDMYDSVMNYRFRDAVIGFITGTDTAGKTVDAEVAMNKLEQIREQYPREAFEAMMNLVDSHDTQRIISAFDGYGKSQKAVANDATPEAKKMMKLVPMLQMTYPGAPTIYYGDEAGMTGADDPDNRRAMIWGKGDKELVEWYSLLANIRNTYPVLRTGDVAAASVPVDKKANILAFTRSLGDERAVVAINNSSAAGNVVLDLKGRVSNGTTLYNAIDGTQFTVVDGKVTVNLPDTLGIILVTNYKEVRINSSALRDAYDSSFVVAGTEKTEELQQVQESFEKVNNTAPNGEVVFVEGDKITRDVLVLAAGQGKTVEIQSGDVSFTITPENLFKLIQKVGDDFVVSVSDKLKDASRIEKLLGDQGAKLIKSINFGTNLVGGILGGEFQVSLQLDKSAYAGKTVYVYYYNPEKGPELIQEVKVDENGMAEFKVTHFSDYFISDKVVKAQENTENQGNQGGNLPKTGSAVDLSTLMGLGLIAASSGAALTVYDRRRKKK